jgi:hypothetical protein
VGGQDSEAEIVDRAVAELDPGHLSLVALSGGGGSEDLVRDKENRREAVQDGWHGRDGESV